jgi:hypothetical protein
MPREDQVTLEAEIGQMLLEQWDPLGAAASAEPFVGYGSQAREVYSLLARGASNVQIVRRLHQIERDEMQHPELAARDLTPLVRNLRAFEPRI